jgi:hypothetical protein
VTGLLLCGGTDAMDLEGAVVEAQPPSAVTMFMTVRICGPSLVA